MNEERRKERWMTNESKNEWIKSPVERNEAKSARPEGVPYCSVWQNDQALQRGLVISPLVSTKETEKNLSMVKSESPNLLKVVREEARGAFLSWRPTKKKEKKKKMQQAMREWMGDKIQRSFLTFVHIVYSDYVQLSRSFYPSAVAVPSCWSCFHACMSK
jgi:hypothetical protein